MIIENILLEFEKEFSNWGSIPHHGPILLLWSTLITKINKIFMDNVNKFFYYYFNYNLIRMLMPSNMVIKL